MSRFEFFSLLFLVCISILFIYNSYYSTNLSYSRKITTSFTFSPSALSALSYLFYLFIFSHYCDNSVGRFVFVQTGGQRKRLGQRWETAAGFVFCSVGRFLVSLFRFPLTALFRAFFLLISQMRAHRSRDIRFVNEWIIDEWLLEWRFAIHFYSFFTLLVIIFFFFWVKYFLGELICNFFNFWMTSPYIFKSCLLLFKQIILRWNQFPIVCDTCFGFISLFVFIKSSLILDYAYIFGYRQYWTITNVNLFKRKKKLEILAFQRFSMRRIACHYLSLILFLFIISPLSLEIRPSLHQPSPDRFLTYQ